MPSNYIPNILLVDDDTLNLRYLEVVLNGLNANLLKAQSGKEAVPFIRNHELALAIIDIHMPHMNGFELASVIQKENARKLVPIIFLTGIHTDKSQIFKGYDTGAVDYLLKPVEKPILLGKVKIFLELDRQRNQILNGKSIFNRLAVEWLRIKQTLKKSEDKFQTIFEESPIGICLFDTRGRINCLNDVCLKQFGITGQEDAKTFDLFNNTMLTASNIENLQEGNIIRQEFLLDFGKIKRLGYNTTSSGFRIVDVLISPIGAEKEDTTGYLAQILDITDRKRTENALRQSEERLKEAQKMGKMGHWEFDLKTKKINWSDQVFELFDRKPELGVPSYEENMAYYYPEDSKLLQECVRKAAENGVSFKLDHHLKQHSGQAVYHTSTINPIKDEEGKIVKLIGTVQDITERKMAELKIRRRLEFEKLTSLISSRFVGIFDLDTAINESLKDIGAFCGANRAYVYQMNQDRNRISITHEWCNPETASQMNHFKNAPLDQLKWFLEQLENDRRLHIQDVNFLPESAVQARDLLLSKKIQSLVMLPIYKKEELGGFIGLNNIEENGNWSEDDFNLLKIFADVLASTFRRHQVETELLESEEMYRTLLNASPDGIVITDLNGRIMEVSNIAMELYGTENDTCLIGKRFLHFIPKDLHRKALGIFSKTLAEGLIQNIELKLFRKDQSQFIGEISTTLIQEPNGRPKAYMAIVRDITQRKKMEKHLIHTERMAGIGGMAAGIAHEINQPLNTISMSMDNILFALQNKTINEDYLENKANKIFDNIFRMRNIIDHVRTFSRDHDDYILSAFNVNESITNAISLISEQFKHRAIHLYVDLTTGIASPIGNTYKFEQVILNLLSNAKDAVEEKKENATGNFKKQIGIKTYQYHDNIFVEVSDNGIGIDSEEINNILLPFYTTKKAGEGTGLGLSISFGIIKEMNGNIDIQSEVSEGTIITICLPSGKKQATTD